MRLQRPTVSAEMSFLLAVLKFYVPSAASSGATPIPFHSEDVLLTGAPFPCLSSCTEKWQCLHNMQQQDERCDCARHPSPAVGCVHASLALQGTVSIRRLDCLEQPLLHRICCSHLPLASAHTLVIFAEHHLVSEGRGSEQIPKELVD